jgi:hypothetical protein
VLEQADLHAIVRLQAHYQILVIDKVWQARRTRHDQGPITADSSHELWDKLRDDYAELAEHEKRLIALAAGADDGPRMRSKEDQTSLNWLRMHYEDHYRIDHLKPADDVAAIWQATWKGSGEPGTLVSDSSVGLRDMMRDDFARRQHRALIAAMDTPGPSSLP